jgi:hypothetical protein
MNTNQQNAAQSGRAASRQWWSDARDLAVSFGPTLEDSIVAWVKLNCRDEVAQTAPSIEFYYSLLSKAFLMMYDNETINPIYPVTDLGQVFIDQIRRATGIGVQSLPAPTPVLSPADKLRAEVINDWRTLSSKGIRAKMSRDRNYAAMFEELSQTDALSSGATTFTVIPGA